MQNKKIPQRTCLGCNEQKNKTELIRVVRTNNGEIFLDKTGKLAGRGAYICPDIECFKSALKKGRIDRSLSVGIPDDIYEKLEREISANE